MEVSILDRPANVPTGNRNNFLPSLTSRHPPLTFGHSLCSTKIDKLYLALENEKKRFSLLERQQVDYKALAMRAIDENRSLANKIKVLEAEHGRQTRINFDLGLSCEINEMRALARTLGLSPKRLLKSLKPELTGDQYSKLKCTLKESKSKDKLDRFFDSVSLHRKACVPILRGMRWYQNNVATVTHGAPVLREQPERSFVSNHLVINGLSSAIHQSKPIEVGMRLSSESQPIETMSGGFNSLRSVPDCLGGGMVGNQRGERKPLLPVQILPPRLPVLQSLIQEKKETAQTRTFDGCFESAPENGLSGSHLSSHAAVSIVPPLASLKVAGTLSSSNSSEDQRHFGRDD
ncbi:hypothetical protein [Endozoicomonas sp.]|uniref:hypothetical protein n=1 Tax=Endozoicomonas sp. TaxID=1892382 RepID=UPI003AF48A50